MRTVNETEGLVPQFCPQLPGQRSSKITFKQTLPKNVKEKRTYFGPGKYYFGTTIDVGMQKSCCEARVLSSCQNVFKTRSLAWCLKKHGHKKTQHNL